ncbi:glycosyltransferase family 4 protein [Ginsengibacter hankyongi]|uniref:Glycosyltransferase family 4 protein n=1 Tax=Ginsengibacter hankyongi TaxID=2607284 RepID=A0A5J5IQK6_9BACT|nr:glycosyltransferase family 1 protein [Ginsengibacter hankyongi]KAA9041882.1 glycosyltransferase family 4 protein [Ginsengibacter hankyongi]
MVIAINIKVTGKNELEENENFAFETVGRIIKLHPEHRFVLISENALNDRLTPSKKVINVAIGMQKKSAALRYLWYNIKIPAVLRKYKADVLISYDGIASLFTNVHQCVFINELAFIHQASSVKKDDLLFYKTFLRRSIKKSKTVITVSEFCKTDLIMQYKTTADKIEVVYEGINENFKEISYEEREQVKAKYTDGNEYFVYTGEIGSDKNLLNLLKAFSAFKKRQKSSMQLLIAGKRGWKYEEFFESVRLFKFKNDVKILKDLPTGELAKTTAAAYALVQPSLYESFATQPLEAMKSGVPVIASSTGALSEICGDAALYADTKNFKEIAVKMMLLFKDENLKKELIEKGKVRAEKFSWEITSDLIWKNVQKIIS